MKEPIVITKFDFENRLKQEYNKALEELINLIKPEKEMIISIKWLKELKKKEEKRK